MKIKNEEVIKDYLKSYPIGEWFDTNVSSLLEVHRYKKNEYICKEMDKLNRLYFIIEGRAKVYCSHRNGKISLISFYYPGTILGELELLGVMETSHTVQSIGDTICVELPLFRIKQELLSDITFLRQIAIYLGRKAVQNADIVMKSQTYALETRLANFILCFSTADLYEEIHVEVAQYLGVSYRHLLRTFASFVKERIIVKENQRFRIVNRVELERISEGLLKDTILFKPL